MPLSDMVTNDIAGGAKNVTRDGKHLRVTATIVMRLIVFCYIGQHAIDLKQY